MPWSIVHDQWDPPRAYGVARQYAADLEEHGDAAEAAILRGAVTYYGCAKVFLTRHEAFAFFQGVLGHVPPELLDGAPQPYGDEDVLS